MIALKKIFEQANGLTQNRFVRGVEGHLPLGSRTMPMIFTRTLMASVTGDYLFEVGAGVLDSAKHAKLLMQYANDVGVPVSEVADTYINLLGVLGYSQESFRKVISGIAGSTEKPARANSIAPVTPTYVYKLVMSVLPENVPEIMGFMVTDYVCHMLAPLGWVLRDAPYAYRIRRNGLFPRYSDLVDVIHAKELQRIIQVMADADLSLVKAAMDKKGAILPAMIAQHLSSAVVTAAELARGTYDAAAIVTSVLTTVARVNNPDLPEGIAPRDRVRNHPAVTELRSNLAIFLATQDMVSSGCEPRIHFNDEEMTSVVLPLFSSALAELSPFGIRLLDDVVAHIGKQSSRTHMGVPGHVFLFEDWEFSSNVSAFVRVKQTATGNQSFLFPQSNVASALSAAMKPVRDALSMKKLVEQRVALYEMTAASSRVPADGTTLVLGLPSIVEYEVMHGIPDGLFQSGILGGSDEPLVDPTSSDKVLVATPTLRRAAYDYYSMVAHVATARADSTHASFQTIQTRVMPVLQWSRRTAMKDPLGKSAIVMGEVVTTEPLELVVYVDDFIPTVAREGRVAPIDDFAHAVHLWDWYSASEQLSFVPTYRVNLRNTSYVTQIDEHEILGLGVRRRQVRFIKPLVAAAVARVWVRWMTDDRAYLAGKVSSNVDDLEKTAYRGRNIQNALQLVNLLTAIGATGAGATSAKTVTQRIAEQMYETGMIDDYSQLHVGVQKHRVNVWAGLVILQLLGLVSSNEAADMVDYLADSDALSLVVGAYELNQ